MPGVTTTHLGNDETPEEGALAEPVTIEEIRAAADLLRGQVVRTPLVPAPRLSDLLGCSLFLKLENLQYTGSFKDRGAYIKLKSLSNTEAAAGVIAMSAGNHAQGVAYHARQLGIPATIVMPEDTPFSKVERTKALGADVVQAGHSIDAAAEAANEIRERDGLTFIHPYDDPKIVAGQGTVGLEMLEDRPDLDTLVIPIGGGGLLAGSAIAAKAAKPDIKIVGVEAELFPSMHQSIHHADPTSGGSTIADGIAVKSPGKLTRAIAETLVEDFALVDEPNLETAVTILVEQQKIVAEGAGAAPLAALLTDPDRYAGKKVGLVISGGNIDARLLAAVLSRGMVRDGRLIQLRIDIHDQPGTLARVCNSIGRLGGNIVEVYHQRLFYDVPARKAKVDVVVETRNAGHVLEIIDALNADGYPARELSGRSADRL